MTQVSETERQKTPKTAKPKAKRRGTLFGRICGFFDKSYASLLEKSIFGRYFTSYEKFDRRVKNSKTVSLVVDRRRRHYKKKYHPKREIGTEHIDDNLRIYNRQTVRSPISSRLRGAAWSNKFVSTIIDRFSSVPNAPASSLGFFLLALSLTSIVVCMAGFFTSDDVDLSSIFFSLIMLFPFVILSVFLLPKNDTSLIDYIFESRFGRAIVIPMLGKEDLLGKKQKKAVPSSSFSSLSETGSIYSSAVAFCLGLILGLLTCLVSISTVISFIVVILILFAVVAVPEAGLLVFALFAPFAFFFENADLVAAVFVITLTFAFAAKAALGNRLASFDALDGTLAIFFGYLFIAELCGGTNHAAARSLSIVSCFCIYYLCKNLLVRGRWLDKFLSCICASSTLVGMFAIARAIILRSPIGTGDIMRSPEMLAVWLLVSLFLTAALLSRRKIAVSTGVVSLAVQCAALVLTGSKSAVIALAVGVLAMAALTVGKVFRIIFVALAASPIALFLLPESFIRKILSVLAFTDDSLVSRFEIWKGSLELVKIEPLCGIGFSGDLFADLYTAVGDGSAASNTQSLYIGMLVTSGIVGSILFAASVLLCFRAAISTCVRMPRAKGGREVLCACITALLSLLICGMTVWIFDYTVCAQLFCVTVGISLAVKRHFEEEEAALYMDIGPSAGDLTIDI